MTKYASAVLVFDQLYSIASRQGDKQIAESIALDIKCLARGMVRSGVKKRDKPLDTSKHLPWWETSEEKFKGYINTLLDLPNYTADTIKSAIEVVVMEKSLKLPYKQMQWIDQVETDRKANNVGPANKKEDI